MIVQMPSGLADVLSNWNPSENVIECAHCRSDYTHHAEVSVRTREAEDGPGVRTTVHPSSVVESHDLADDAAEFAGRRGDVSIYLDCEQCDGRTEIRIMQHKGQTLFGVRKSAK